MWFSGRATTTSDQNVVTSTSRSDPNNGSSLKNPLYPTITSWSSPSRRTCHNDVLPEKKAALPPRAMNASTVSRIPLDQYSSWPTERYRFASSNSSGNSSRSAFVHTPISKPSRSAHSKKGSSQSGHPAEPAQPERWLIWM